MKSKRLSREFFNRPTLAVAKELLGKFLVRKVGRKIITGIITETEAYCGPNDLASHASRGRTKRTEVMFGPPGHAYVYLIYGMYHCFNIVTERDGYPAAVLIRGISVLTNQKLKIKYQNDKSKFKNKNSGLKVGGWQLAATLAGPGKLCRHFRIDKTLNREDLIKSKKLWVEDRGAKVKANQIKRLRRINIDYAGIYKDKLWRFILG